MSNVKMVRIVADVPFNWLSQGEGGLPDSEIALIGSVLLSPSIGLTYRYEEAGLRPNSRGGQTTMYRLTIAGQEALSWQLLNRLVKAILASGEFAQVRTAEAMDIEDGVNGWASLL